MQKACYYDKNRDIKIARKSTLRSDKPYFKSGGKRMAKTIRMTTAQAIVKFLDNQYVQMDGVETKFVMGFYTIFGHGIAVGL